MNNKNQINTNIVLPIILVIASLVGLLITLKLQGII